MARVQRDDAPHQNRSQAKRQRRLGLDDLLAACARRARGGRAAGGVSVRAVSGVQGAKGRASLGGGAQPRATHGWPHGRRAAASVGVGAARAARRACVRAGGGSAGARSEPRRARAQAQSGRTGAHQVSTTEMPAAFWRVSLVARCGMLARILRAVARQRRCRARKATRPLGRVARCSRNPRRRRTKSGPSAPWSLAAQWSRTLRGRRGASAARRAGRPRLARWRPIRPARAAVRGARALLAGRAWHGQWPQEAHGHERRQRRVGTAGGRRDEGCRCDDLCVNGLIARGRPLPMTVTEPPEQRVVIAQLAAERGGAVRSACTCSSGAAAPQNASLTMRVSEQDTDLARHQSPAKKLLWQGVSAQSWKCASVQRGRVRSRRRV